MATKEELEEQLAQTRADLKVLASMASAHAGQVARDATDDVNDRLHGLSEETRQLMEDARSQAKRTARQAEEAMSANPLATAGIAFGVGVLLGTLLRR